MSGSYPSFPNYWLGDIGHWCNLSAFISKNGGIIALPNSPFEVVGKIKCDNLDKFLAQCLALVKSSEKFSNHHHLI